MTIHLPENLESPILAAVHSGRYASLDDAMAEAASLLVHRLKQEQAQAEQLTANQAEPTPNRKPVWEENPERIYRRSFPTKNSTSSPDDSRGAA